MVRYPPLWYLVSHRHICAIPHFATYRAIIVRYPTKTSTEEFCDTIAASIARYEKYRYWASKLTNSHFQRAFLGQRHCSVNGLLFAVVCLHIRLTNPKMVARDAQTTMACNKCWGEISNVHVQVNNDDSGAILEEGLGMDLDMTLSGNPGSLAPKNRPPRDQTLYTKTIP